MTSRRFSIAKCGVGTCIPFCVWVSQALGCAQPPAFKRVNGPLSLKEAVTIGLRESPAVHAAQFGLTTAQAATRTARSMTQPQLSFNSYFTLGSMSNIFGTSPNVTPVNTLAVTPKAFTDQNLTLMAPIYTGGRLSSLVRAAGAAAHGAAEDLSETEVETAFTIKIAYYRGLLAEELVKVAQARLDATEELVRNADALFREGKGIEASLRRAEAERADAQRELTTARNNAAKALLDLKTAMGVSLDSGVRLTDALAFVPLHADPSQAIAEALKRRPAVRAARARLAAASAQVDAAKGSLSPQVYGAAMADAFSSKAMGTGSGYTLGVVVSFPLVDAGQRRSEVSGAQGAKLRAEAEEQGVELQVTNEVRQAWLDVVTAEENYHSAESALRSAEAAYAVTALRVQNQKGIQVELLDAIAALTRARANLAQALYDHSAARAALQRAMGEDGGS
ncbi:MAG: TolC family protein [Chthonomonadales bacterium]